MKREIEVLKNKIIESNQKVDELKKATTEKEIIGGVMIYALDLVVIAIHIIAITEELKALINSLFPERRRLPIKGQKLLMERNNKGN